MATPNNPPPLNPIYGLTPADKDKVQELYDEFKRRVARDLVDRQAFPEHEEHQAPEFYVGKTDSSGIPTASGDTPGYGTVVVYQLVGDEEDAELVEIEGFENIVYNTGSTIPSDTLVQLARDKYGKWWVITGGGESSFLAVLVEISYPEGPEGKRVYGWAGVTGTPLDYILTGQYGCEGSNPAYHEGNDDWPVVGRGDSDITGTGTGTAVSDSGCPLPAFVHPWSVVRMRQQGGDNPSVGTATGDTSGYCLFGGHVKVGLFRRTGIPSGIGWEAYHRTYNQNSGGWQDAESVIEIEAE